MTGEKEDDDPKFQGEIDSNFNIDSGSSFELSEDSEEDSIRKDSLATKVRSQIGSLFSGDEEEPEFDLTDETSRIHQDMEVMRESLENKIDTKLELLEEEIEEKDSEPKVNVDRVRSELKQEIEETKEELKEEIDSREEKLRKEISSVEQDVNSIESEIESLVDSINSKIDKSQHEELEKLKEVSNRISKIEGRLDEKADNSDLNEIKEDQELIDEKLNEKFQEYEMSDKSPKLSEELNMLKKEAQKLDVGNSSTPLTPSEVTENMKGNYINVKGTLEFKKEFAEEYLYTITGEDDKIVVKSENKMKEGERTVEGVIKELEGFFFLQSV